MTRRYDEPVDVRRRDEVPAEFLWRGRLYVVRGIFASWVETDAWWATASVRELYGQTPAASDSAGSVPVPVPGPVPSPGFVAAAQSPVPPAPEILPPPSALPVGSEPAEREMWRVEASSGRTAGTGVFDLCFDWSVGRWNLAQVLD